MKKPILAGSTNYHIIHELQLPQRYLALDVLRGMTIALMIVVNTPGSWDTIYVPFRHASWHGFTLTDLVFPSFLFVVGNAMSFSLKKWENQGEKVFLKKVFKRTILIFLLGLLLNTFPFLKRINGELTLIDFTHIRLMGVLQRIALCYAIASLVIHYYKVKGAIIFSGFVLVGYWILLYFLGEQPDPYSLEGNAALKLDGLVIPSDNLYKGFGIPFDPEGLVSTLPAIVNVICGYLAGLFIQSKSRIPQAMLKLVLTGLILTLAGLVWNQYFPINKPIWTSSYVLHTVGIDLIILAGLMLIIERAGYSGRWTYFFEVFGRNSLFIFILSGVSVRIMNLIRIEGLSLNGWIYQHVFANNMEGRNASLLYAICFMLMLWMVGLWMDRKKIYVKV